MPVYNAAPYLREAMDSILCQTFNDFEFLIIDDGSTDASVEIIESYHDPRIVHAKNTANLGLVATLNLGIDLARGEYIARMDSDDISLPERFAQQVGFMNAYPKVGACGTAYRYFGEVDREISPPTQSKQAFALLSSTSCLGHPTSMIRKSVLDNHGIRYEPTYEGAEDYALWIRMGWVSQLCSLPEMLLFYRWHSKNKSKTDLNNETTRSKARILWYELMLGPLEEPQRFYLEGNLCQWEYFMKGRRLLDSVLKSPLVDQDFFSELFITEWESKLIKCFGIKGLLMCFSKPAFRKRGRATTFGLLAQYLSRYGIKFKR